MNNRAWLGALLGIAACLVAGTLPGVAFATTPSISLEPAVSSVAHGEDLLVRWTIEGGDGGRFRDVISVVSADGARAPQAVEMLDEAVLPDEQLEGSFTLPTARFLPEPGGWRLISGTGLSVPIDVEPATVNLPRFEDRTAAAGLLDPAWRRANPVRCTPNATGAALGDIDGDDDLDLYVPAYEGGGRLYENDGTGAFREVTREAGLAVDDRDRTGAVFVDIDADGDLDLHVLADGRDELYRNDGSGSFRDVAEAIGLDDAGPATSASWDDVDGDGLLDAYVVVYGRCTASDYDLFESDRQDRLYLQRPDGSFVRTDDAIPDFRGYGFGALFTDVDGDSDRDVLLANDARITANAFDADRFAREIARIPGNRLLINEGGTFTDHSVNYGVAAKMNSMGIGSADIDADGDLDYAISNLRASRLYRADDERFTDVAGEYGSDRPLQDARTPTTSWGVLFVDVDLDGQRDLLMPSGALSSGDDVLASAEALKARTLRMDFAAPNTLALLLREPDRFREVTGAAGMLRAGMWRGAAVGDIDGDGVPDIVAAQLNGGPVLLHNATAVAGGHLRLRPRPADGAADACGAFVRVQFDDGDRPDQVEEVYCGGEGLASSHERVIRVGALTAEGSGISSVEVRWPDGEQTSHAVDGGAPGTVVELQQREGTSPNGKADGPAASSNGPESRRAAVALMVGALIVAVLLIVAVIVRRRGRRP